jgi:peptidyl-prolyl cis-trans isomerase A (cyclophilin A)
MSILKLITSTLFIICFHTSVFAQANKDVTPEHSEEKRIELLTYYDQYKNVFAEVFTNHGNFTIELYPKRAPFTVHNFIGLAEGTKEFIDIMDAKLPKVKRPFYNGLTFHRIAPNFVIQGGCPRGNGTGGPGYQFDDEISPLLDFGRPGMVAMANSGKNTNGSQFFVTLNKANFLNKNYSIFGEVREGMDVVKKIGKVPTFPNERPRKKVIIEKIEIKKLKNGKASTPKKAEPKKEAEAEKSKDK